MLRVKDHKFLYRRGDQYYFRRKVPKGLEAAFGGKSEWPVALHTSDLSLARRKSAKELEKFETKVEKARGAYAVRTDIREPAIEPSTLQPTMADIEVAVRRWLTDRVERGSSAISILPSDARAKEAFTLQGHKSSVQAGLGLTAQRSSEMTLWLAEAIAEREKWVVDTHAGWWRSLLSLCGRGQLEANDWLLQDLEDRPRVITDARFHPEAYRRDEGREKQRVVTVPVSITSLLDVCLAEKKVAPSTAKVWKRHVNHFVEFLGDDDATRVERTHVVAWKERLLSEPNRGGDLLSRRTIQDSYLACIKGLFAWAAENGKVATNPAFGIKVAGKTKSVQLRDRGFRDDEALRILRAIQASSDGKISPERLFARRWVPWICAYTGARVNEITQLRAEDVNRQSGVWTIHITPEAGPVKNSLPRTVALHSHLVDQGFIAAVEGKVGPIFYNPALERGGSDAHPQCKKVGEFLARWVRADVGVTDKGIWPNHAWRHRFKTTARVVGMDAEIRDFIQGHVPRTEGEAYGHIPAEVTQREIEKLPRFKIEE